MKNILFVCTGNTCRSPMAEGIFKDIIKNDIYLNTIIVDSAGTEVLFAEGANDKAIKVLKQEGIDISTHIAKQVTDELIKEAEMILTMTVGHKNRILDMSENAQNKTFTLKEYVRENNIDDMNICDPYGLSLDEYKVCADQIKQQLEKLKLKLKKLGGI